MAIFTVKTLQDELDARAPEVYATLDEERRKELAAHYATRLEKYGYFREDGNAEAFDFLTDYFGRWWAATREGCEPLHHGFMLYGKNGRGKTAPVRIFAALFGIDFVTATEISVRFQSDRPSAFWNWITDKNGAPLIIDDIANEGAARSFGNAIPMPAIIDIRNETMERDGALTFFTSNIENSAALAERYGDAARSRIFALIGRNFVKVEGYDHRIAKEQKQ